MTSFPAGL
uniref:Uncharacterized protein n=1 Tax=Anguilla anguilla TaxID=7936 RepID=A0A0E9PQB4_ANGAN